MPISKRSDDGFVLYFPGRVFFASPDSIHIGPVSSAFARPMHNARRRGVQRYVAGLE